MHGSFMYVLVKAVHNITQQYLRLDFLTFQIYVPMRCNFIGRLVLGFVVTFAIFITLIALTLDPKQPHDYCSHTHVRFVWGPPLNTPCGVVFSGMG